MQTFIPNLTPYFEVAPATCKTSVEDDGSEDYALFAEDEGEKNAWEISPWLLAMQWHEHICRYNVNELVSLVASPKKHAFPFLSERIHEYFAEATRRIKELDNLTLEQLNLEKQWQVTQIGNELLKEHEQKSMLRQYTAQAVRLLTFLVRMRMEEHIYKVSLPSEVVPLQEWDDIISIHSTLYSLWTYQFSGHQDGVHMQDPMMRYLALSTLQAVGTFHPPVQVTNKLAAFKHLIRLVMVYELVESDCANEAQVEIRCRYLRQFVIDKQRTTFGAIASLQHLASAQAYQTTNHPCIFWID
ncbi:hypothetical protein FISHEDRAFT_75583 [Fistulina hepatica ATCC 64428]|uniref:Uncharacterized protein n=1 Tax=Fistulina hepatica ATCC 64428 TaxID=1128425 RepID=A0A0D7A6Q5_9AGAR|nr:hypothetical protein FISHEDRAFT_75583 [Fistulina hepatica ATCC 64428]